MNLQYFNVLAWMVDNNNSNGIGSDLTLLEYFRNLNPHCSTSDTKRPLADRKLTNPLSVEVLRHFFIEKCL